VEAAIEGIEAIVKGSLAKVGIEAIVKGSLAKVGSTRALLGLELGNLEASEVMEHSLVKVDTQVQLENLEVKDMDCRPVVEGKAKDKLVDSSQLQLESLVPLVIRNLQEPSEYLPQEDILPLVNQLAVIVLLVYVLQQE
jgi:hypothetical protein